MERTRLATIGAACLALAACAGPTARAIVGTPAVAHARTVRLSQHEPNRFRAVITGNRTDGCYEGRVVVKIRAGPVPRLCVLIGTDVAIITPGTSLPTAVPTVQPVGRVRIVSTELDPDNGRTSEVRAVSPGQVTVLETTSSPTLPTRGLPTCSCPGESFVVRLHVVNRPAEPRKEGALSR